MTKILNFLFFKMASLCFQFLFHIFLAFLTIVFFEVVTDVCSIFVNTPTDEYHQVHPTIVLLDN